MNEAKLAEAITLGYIVPAGTATSYIKISKCGKYWLTMAGFIQWTKERMQAQGLYPR